MSVRLKTMVRQLRLVAGQWQKETPDLAVLEPSPRLPLGRERGNLYVLAEVEDGDDRTCHRIIEIIQQEFLHTPGSVTRRLRRAIQAANVHLSQENQDAPQDQQRSAGVSCIVLKGEEVYIAQSGPALVYLLQDGALHRLPTPSPWLPPTSPYLSPLGIKREAEINLSHCRVAPGDVILLSSSSLILLATEEEIAEAIDQEADVAVKDLAALAAGQDFSALVVEITPEVEEAEPIPAEVVEEPRAGALAGVGDFLSRLDVVGGLSTLLRGALTLLQRTLPEREALPQERPAEERVRRALLAGLALAIPLLIAALVIYVYTQQQEVRQIHLGSLIQEATERRAAALVEPDRAAARELLREAQARIEEALHLQPDNAIARSLQEQIQAHLDELSTVARLTGVTPLATLPEDGSRSQRVIVHGSDVYVLDQGAQRVYRYRLTEAGDGLENMHGEVVLSQGQGLVDMAWVGTGGARQREGLLVLESGGSLLEVDAMGGVTVLPVAESQTLVLSDKDRAWERPLRAGGFQGNFYLLAPQRNQILKVVPTDRGYDVPPEEWLKPETEVELSHAMDMAIDGFIYVLLADGTIFKFNTGLREPFDQEGLDEPLRSPTALFATPESRSLYVADAGHRRIVQFSRQGTFQRQLHPPPGSEAFDSLWSLWVDEAQGKLYFLSGDRLYVADMPLLD
jgi:hypothetical protein